ncbi:MAG: cupredoxin domain-containing protein [Pseudonocardiaceae bacterium]
MITPRAAAVRFRPISMVLFAMSALVMGCGGGAGREGTSGAAAAPDTIVIKNFTFVPATVTVAAGTRITVINQDQAPHTVTANDKSFDTATIAGGQRGEIMAPGKPGSYSYLCTFHQYMTGTLIVK